MIINEKGKIFNTINIIDLMIVVLIGLLIFGGVSKFSTIENLEVEANENYMVEFILPEVTIGSTENVAIGDMFYDSVRSTELGKVVSFRVEPHYQMLSSLDGKTEFKEIPNLYDLIIVLDAVGSRDENGLLIATKRYFVGSETRIKSSKIVSDANIINITEE